jgi:hypothetical protein
MSGGSRRYDPLAMAMQRFLSDVDRTRRGAGWIFMAAALGLAGGLVRLEIQGGRVSVTALVLFALLAGLFYLGLRLTRARDFFEIDVERREYSVTRGGKRSGKGALDALGPLEVKERINVVSTGNRQKTTIEYVVHAAAHSNLDLYSERSAGQARRRMESLARAWRVSGRSLGGAVRGPDDLDVPLHQRLRDDPAARTAAPLRPEWGVQIESLSLGYAMRSTLRSWAPLRTSGLILVVGLVAFSRFPAFNVVSALRQADDLLSQVLLGLMGVVFLVVLWMVARGVRDTFFPGTVRITDRGVSYRFARLAFAKIEEVAATFPIEVIGDRRSVKLGETFCAPGAAKAVAYELQRLILEVAEANPHARSS